LSQVWPKLDPRTRVSSPHPQAAAATSPATRTHTATQP
jgi:hypothetical protein